MESLAKEKKELEAGETSKKELEYASSKDCASDGVCDTDSDLELMDLPPQISALREKRYESFSKLLSDFFSFNSSYITSSVIDGHVSNCFIDYGIGWDIIGITAFKEFDYRILQDIFGFKGVA